MSCSEILHGLVARSLSVFDTDSARFFAERLCCEERSEANLNLLAQCYFRQGKYKQTYLILRDSIHPSNRYLFAMACFHINKLTEAERALSPNLDSLPQKLSDDEIGSIPEGSSGLFLLGRICRRMQRREAAMFYLKKAIEVRTRPLIYL
jgi:anaphase-promoting complex subunit 3